MTGAKTSPPISSSFHFLALQPIPDFISKHIARARSIVVRIGFMRFIKSLRRLLHCDWFLELSDTLLVLLVLPAIVSTIMKFIDLLRSMNTDEFVRVFELEI